MRTSDVINLAMSVEMKVNLGNYESATVFVCLSGVPAGATADDIEDAMDTAGMAWEILRARVSAQAEEIKGGEPAPRVARQSRPAAVEVPSYDDDAKRELSVWARGIGMDRDTWALIENKRGAGSWHALFKAREAGCKTARQLLEYCIDGIYPPSVDEYDPFEDDGPGKSTSSVKEPQQSTESPQGGQAASEPSNGSKSGTSSTPTPDGRRAGENTGTVVAEVSE